MRDILKEQLNRLKLGGKTYLRVSPNLESDILDVIAANLVEGVDIIELSGRFISPADFLNIAKNVKLLCAQFDKTFIIEGRADIAYLTEADGIFLRQGDIDIPSVRKLLGASTIVGTNSLHTEGADYLLAEQNIINSKNLPCFVKTKTENILEYYTLKKNIPHNTQ